MTSPRPSGASTIEIDVLAALRRAWLMVLLLTVLGGAVAVVWTYRMRPVYRVRSTLLLPDSQTSPGSALAGVGASLGLSDKAHPLDILNGILTSHTARAAISAKTGVPIRALEWTLGSSVDTSRNVLTLTADMEDPDLALRTIGTATRVLDNLAGRLNSTRAGRQADLLNAEVRRYTAQLAATERELLDFQRRMKTAPPDMQEPGAPGYVRQLRDLEYKLDQTEHELALAREGAKRGARSAVELPTGLPVSTWRAKVLELDYRLQVAQVSLGSMEPSVVKLRGELDVARRQLALEIARYIRSVDRGVDPSIASLAANKMLLTWQVQYVRALANAAPEEAAEMQRLVREQTVLGNVLAGIRADYAKARIEADVDRVRFSVLDPPYVVEGGPVNKRYVAYGAFGSLAGLLIGVLGACLRSPGTAKASD